MTGYSSEVLCGERFQFGENWSRFLAVLSAERIAQAENSLCDFLGNRDLCGKTFLDVGSGSGLFSLAARRLGARVHSFDYDPLSVACTVELKRRYYPDDTDWTVAQGSVLDIGHLQSLGQWDIVYAWGVLHHTGAMWDALHNIVPLVKEGGRLFIAIYNDQGRWSRRWRAIKRSYNKLPDFFKPIFAFIILGSRELKFLILASLKGRGRDYFDNIVHYSQRSMRGMSYWHDLIDWIGGYPFEVAKPEEIFMFLRKKGFRLDELKTNAGDLACNQFVFTLNHTNG